MVLVWRKPCQPMNSGPRSVQVKLTLVPMSIHDWSQTTGWRLFTHHQFNLGTMLANSGLTMTRSQSDIGKFWIKPGPTSAKSGPTLTQLQPLWPMPGPTSANWPSIDPTYATLAHPRSTNLGPSLAQPQANIGISCLPWPELGYVQANTAVELLL